MPFGYWLIFSILILSACARQVIVILEPATTLPTVQRVDSFLNAYNAQYKRLSTESSEAQWTLNTKIVEGDTLSSFLAKQASQAYADYTGSKQNIYVAQTLLNSKGELTPIQIKQVEKILYNASNNPGTLPELVSQRIAAETEQTEKLFGYNFLYNGKSVSTNTLDSILTNSNDTMARRLAWESSKEVGKVLGDGLQTLQDLRNRTVKGLGYSDYFTYQVSDYGMNSDEMMALNRQLVRDLWPLYRELHTYARYELAAKYKVDKVPELLPAHWLPNRWGQDWSSIVEVKGLNIDSALKSKDADWILKKGEEFYVSLGFPSLPASFYQKSSLYPVPDNAGYKKNNHASAWHMDLDNDVRSLMSVVPNAEWYETVNHELGHIYYYMSYSRPEVPYILREGANRAYHEAFGTMIGLAALQKPFLAQHGLVSRDAKYDKMKVLLAQAMNYVVFIPWSAGVMTEFEHDLYTYKLPRKEYNTRWWSLVKKYQGIEPPNPRNPTYTDAASKTHINDDAAQYYDYALSSIILFQIHDHIAKNILKQDPRETNYFNNVEVGNFLKSIMSQGAMGDWRQTLVEKTGSPLSAKAMLDYFSPLMDYLKEVNKGRTYTLGQTPG